MAKQWTLISQTVTDHITVPKTATNVNITRQLNNAKDDWTSIAKIVNKYDIKNGTHNSVIQRILDIKKGKIKDLSEITGKKDTSTSNSNTGTTDSNTSTDTSTSGGTVVGSGGLNSTVSKVPITDPVEALEFAKTEWNKIRRDDGRQVECKVQGSLSYKPGLWARVFLPSYFIDDYMYITKVSNEEDGTNNWTTNLTLVDYPPSFGVPEETDGGS